VGACVHASHTVCACVHVYVCVPGAIWLVGVHLVTDLAGVQMESISAKKSASWSARLLCTRAGVCGH